MPIPPEVLRTVGMVVLILAATFALYAPVLGYDFVGLDDKAYVSENPMTRGGLSMESLKWAWTVNLQGYWAPVLWLSYMLDATCFGPEPRGFHFTNVLLHAINAVLVFGLLSRWTGRLDLAVWIALLWACHPLRVESVAWIAQRKDVLSGFFFLLCLWAYVRAHQGDARNGRWIAGSAGFLTLGLMVKSVLITTPFVLLLLDRWPLRRRGLRLATEKWAFWLIALVFGVIYGITNFASGIPHLPSPSFARRVLLIPGNYLTYLRQTLWPQDLSVLYNKPEFSAPIFLLALVVLGGITGAVWLARRGRPALLVGWLWFLGMLVPSIGFIWVGTSQGLGDRFTYLPHIGLALALAGGLAGLRFNRMWWIPAAVLLLALATLSRQQMETWRNSETMYRRAVDVADRNARAYGSLGVLYAVEGRDEALALLHRSLELQPLNQEARLNLAKWHVQRGEWRSAVEHYRIAVANDPDQVEALNDLAWLLATDPGAGPDQAAEAVALARRAIERAGGRHAALLNTLARALAATGDFESAADIAREALARTPPTGEGLALRERIQERLNAYERGVLP